ncbi:hypothetical protein RDI58_010548 [Solanum bulbocastanum]|uniref:Uncharacterized protein n=1 Tax=Solanum bulbocastanum TaxID=147425 RepID=A0AAN8TUL8_SOLBU
MQSQETLLESFPFNKRIEVLANGNSGGILVLWDENFLELDEIATRAGRSLVSCCPHDDMIILIPVCNVKVGTYSISKNNPFAVKAMAHILAKPIRSFTNQGMKNTIS